MRSYWLFLILFIAGLSPGPLHSQQPYSIQYDQQHFTDENGLAQNSVKFITADKDGFTWLATENGLVRYDGHRFVTFNKSFIPLQSSRIGAFYPADSTKLPNSNAFFAISDHYEYVGIKDGNVFLNSAGFEKFLSDMPVRNDYDSGKAFISLSLPNLFKTLIKAEKCIIPDASGGFFVCTPTTVSYYIGKQKKYEHLFAAPDSWSFFRMGTALFHADDKGQFRKFGPNSIRPIPLTGDILDHPAYRGAREHLEIYWNNAGNQAFLYLQKSLYLLEENTPGELYTRLILTDFDYKINNIISIYYDKPSRVVFMGSLNKGLYTFSPRQFKTLSIGGNDKEDIYYAQAPWGNDQVLTTQGNVLGLKTSFVLPVMKKPSEWSRYSLLVDRRGWIWTLNGNHINKFDKKGKNLLARWDVGEALTQLYEGNDGQIWIGTGKKGIYRIDPYNPHAVPYAFPTRKTILAISCMQQEGEDMMWAGTGVGLYRLHLQTGVIDTIKGLEQSYIRSIHISRPGQVWITTYGSGFFLYDGQCLHSFPMDKAGYLATSHCFVDDSLGFCWIPTNRGLFQTSKTDLLNYAEGKQRQVFYLYHTREEGFYTNEFNGGCQPCAVKLPNGYVSLPSLNGVVWFAPATMKTPLPDKKIFIDRIEVEQKAMALKDSITLSRGFKLLKIYCSTPYYGNEYNINMQYAWVKENEKPIWLSLDNSDKVISQSSLQHGVYTLIIRKADGFGKENFSYRKLTVTVPPAFYETYWFYGVLLVLFIFLVWIYARLRLRYIRHMNTQLEGLVGQRTEELRRTLSALSVSEQNTRRQMHVREILFTAISHDIGSPLKYISMIAEELKIELETENIPARTKKHAEDIFQSGYYLYHLTRNLLQYLRISEESSSLQYERFDLHRLVENKAIIFRPIAYERSVALINQVPEPFYLHNDPLLLEVIIHNLLDNAVKATRQGSVSVRITDIAGQTHLVIEDTGPGMPKEVADYYNREITAHDTNTKPRGSYYGFGLNIVRELARLMGVNLHIETSARGTAIHLVFRQPLPGDN